MGREVRRVPANWEHPRKRCQHSPWAGGCDEAKRNNGQCFQPLYDEDYETAAKAWLKNCLEYVPDDEEYPFYWDYDGNPPNKDYYRPKWSEAEMAWFQVYETVSEGTPVTPAFATTEALVDYLVQQGDRWDQIRGEGGWDRKAATEFVGSGWAPSFIVSSDETGVQISAPRTQKGQP